MFCLFTSGFLSPCPEGEKGRGLASCQLLCWTLIHAKVVPSAQRNAGQNNLTAKRVVHFGLSVNEDNCVTELPNFQKPEPKMNACVLLSTPNVNYHVPVAVDFEMLKSKNNVVAFLSK